MEEKADYPIGGFIADAICPYDGSEIKVNVPATPIDKGEITSKMKCPKCKGRIYIIRYSDGSWKITRDW
jgi:hypothetical protein